MNKKIISPVSAFILSLVLSYNTVEGKIGIIVNKHLYPSIQTSVDMYINDVKNIEGKDVWLDGTTFDESNNKTDLKDSLRNHYNNDDLEGAILIGDLPICEFLTDETFERDIFPCDLYYMDLNGTWTPEDLPDTHSGSKYAEIWISRLVCSVLTHYANQTETQILQRYFDRVHLRMYGQDNQPSTYLIAGMYGEWPSLESENKPYLGYNSNSTETLRTYSDSTDPEFKEKWANALIAGKEYAYIYSHAGGLPYRHKFGYYIYDIYTDPTNCRFYNVYCCQNARFTTKNMCGAYATEDQGLVSIGAAKSGSMRPGSYRAYNEPLGDGKNFGEAFKNWYNNEGLSSISWHYGMTVQGVGTLHIQPYDPPADNSAPTGLALSGRNIDENAGANAFIGTLSTTDPDAGQTHGYRLIYGDGDTDNDSFAIVGDTLRAKVSFDYEKQSSFSIRIRTIDNGTGNLWYEKAFTITVNNVNEAPGAIALSNQSVDENAGADATVGTLSSADPETNQTHTYTLVNGTGDIDNGSFTISADILLANASFDYETKSRYSIRIRTTDNGTGNLWYEQLFTISVNNVNETPTALALSNQNINENAGANATLGAFSTTDPDTGQAYTYTLAGGTGSIDNACFTISGNSLLANASFDYETKNSYSIRVRTTDNGTGNPWFEGVFIITVNNLNESPTSLVLTGQSIDENAAASSTVGTFSSIDQDSGQTHSYTLVTGTGAVDNSGFSITGNTLLTNSSFDYETKNSYSIRVRTTDNGTPIQLHEEICTVTVNDINEAPTGITLSGRTIGENAGVNAQVGTFSSVDPDNGQIYTYTLATGSGDTDNVSFNIVGNILQAGFSFDFETKNIYAIRIRTTDNGAGNLWYETPFTITVNNINEAPVDITLDNLIIKEKYYGATVGNVVVADPDFGDAHSLTVNDARFEITANVLKLKEKIYLNYDSEPVVPLAITATDNGSLSLTRDFQVTVLKDTAGSNIGLYSKHLFIAAPNPVIGKIGNIVIFSFSTKGIVYAKLRIFDAVGNEVYRSPTVPGVTGKVSWDLTNRRGRVVGSGMYVALLQVTDTKGRKRILRTNLGVKQEK